MAEKGAKIKFVADTSKFNDSIKKANSEIKLMSAELKLNAKEMARTGESAEGLEKKQGLLSNQLKASEDKTKSLNQKIEKAVECFGENSTEVTNLKIQLANAKAEQEKFRMMLDSCNDKLEEQRRVEAELNSETNKLTDIINKQESQLSKLKQEYVETTLTYGGTSDEAKKLAREIQDLSSELNENKTKIKNASDKADELDKSLEQVEDSAEDAGDGFTVMKGAIADLVANGISTLISGIGNAVTGFLELSEETQEYREDIVKLNTAFESAGHTTKQATSVYKELFSVFGEEDRAVEAAQQIANISKNEEDMARMTEIATGAWARWGDSLATEALMEGISHTSKLGEVQGNLADALEWCGITVDNFNKKLAEKTTEEERSALILDTLEALYKGYASNYKQNNKSIIAARKATSDYNDVLAEMGEELEPLNTEITEMKTELLKGLTPTVKKEIVPAFKEFTEELDDSGAIEDFSDMVGEIAEIGLPMLADVLKFVTENYKDLAVGIGITVVAFQTMSIVSTVTTAIESATTAMGVFNAIMAANPIGAVVTVVGMLAVGVLTLSQNTGDAIDTMDLFSAEELELIETTQATSEAIAGTKASVNDISGSLTAEMEHTKQLADELMKLADESGKVQEVDQVRAQFILNELNKALGTEYSMVDGVIQQYSTLEKSVYDVINAKTANALLEAKSEEYIAAIQGENEALQQVNENYDLYQQKLSSSQQAEENYRVAYEEYQQKMADAKTQGDYMAMQSDAKKIEKLKQSADEEKAMLDKAKQAYDDALFNYGTYLNNIAAYEDASMLIQKGNYEEAISMLQNKGNAYFDYADDVSQATKNAVDKLYEEAVQAGINAELTKENFENGVEGYTKEMVEEAEQGYKDALDKWANAYSDANSVGKDLSSGLEKGMMSKKSSLLEKARSIVAGIIAAMRKEADSHSPARKTIAFGEDMGEGAEIGLDNKTDDVVRSAKNQVNEVMDVYRLDLSKPMTNIGGFNELPAERDVVTPLEQSINNSSFASLLSVVSALVSRPIVLKVNDKTVAEAIASANDDVSGLRNEFKSRGLVLG